MGSICQNQRHDNCSQNNEQIIKQPIQMQAIRQKIKRNRIEQQSFPIINTNIQQKIKKYTKYEENVNKIWKIKYPINIYYSNLEHGEDIPIGLCIIYKLKDNGEFMGYYQGHITENGLPELKNALYVFHNGSYLIGIDDDKAKYCNQNTKLTYEGGWENEMPQGQGTQENNKGVYTGGFNRGEKQGFGRFIWIDGSVYEGNFLKGMFDGTGKLTDSLNSYQYEGTFKCGQKHGKGIEKNNVEIYEGEFEQGYRSGYGKLNIFIGNQNQYQIYSGKFQDNLPHGKGQYIRNNQCIKGVWQKGILIVIL